ncbi:hypothetical protein EBZ38_03995, partial [bacterium]|nr:hypothetical protein [bacterium]
MTPLEKIAALKAGEIDGLLEKTIYKGAALVSRTMMHGRKELSPNRQMALARFDAKANAAKV